MSEPGVLEQRLQQRLVITAGERAEGIGGV